MRLKSLGRPFIALNQAERLKIVQAVQEDRLKNKRGVREAQQLIKDLRGMNEEDRKHVASAIKK